MQNYLFENNFMNVSFSNKKMHLEIKRPDKMFYLIYKKTFLVNERMYYDF